MVLVGNFGSSCSQSHRTETRGSGEEVQLSLTDSVTVTSGAIACIFCWMEVVIPWGLCEISSRAHPPLDVKIHERQIFC